MKPGFDVVTGAFSYTGRYIAERLLADGRPVKTLSRSRAGGSQLGGEVAVAPFNFERPQALTESLRGATTLYNTYWIRFPHGNTTYDAAVANTLVLLRSAEQAGVRRIVHLSVTNASEASPFPYFRGKAIVEREIRDSTLSHAIVRPTLVFGRGDILVNNIAWLLRRFPLFLLPGQGEYRVQPVAAEDVAAIAVDAGRRGEDLAVDAAGPEVYTFLELVKLVRGAIGSRARIAQTPPGLALAVGTLIGRVRRDVLVTREEVAALRQSLLVSGEPPAGLLRFSDWLAENAGTLGLAYVSELERNFRAPV